MPPGLTRLYSEACAMTADREPINPFYFPLNTGHRFSLKARTPSW
jgi:hypothetical protein